MAYYPKVGEKKTVVPKAFEAGLSLDTPRAVTGEIVWIHPAGRFYLVRVDINGHSWCETVFMGE